MMSLKNLIIGLYMSNFETVLIQALLETNEEFEKKGLLSERERINNAVQMSLFEANSSLYNIKDMLEHIIDK